MKRAPSARIALFATLFFILVGTAPLTLTALQKPTLEDGLGKWVSTERFEGEPRIAVALRRGSRSLEGWAVLLGQHRKGDDHATLGLSFSDATWDGGGFKFNTILPEEEGTIGWELRAITPTTAILTAMTLDGLSMNDDDLRWEMTR